MKKLFLIIFLYTSTYAFGQAALKSDGSVPYWIVSGPFEQPLTGFGVPGDKDVIGEKDAEPFWGKEEKSALSSNGTTEWIPQEISGNGFLDFNNSIRWSSAGNVPDKIWYAKAGYAAAYIESSNDIKVKLLFGSNSAGKLFINGSEVYSNTAIRNAVKDQDTVTAELKKGKNLILVKVNNTHNNHEIAFFGMINWEWGFYLRITDTENRAAEGLSIFIPKKEKELKAEAASTFYYKKKGGELLQRIDVVVTNPGEGIEDAEIRLELKGKEYKEKINYLPFGISRHQIYVHEAADETEGEVSLITGKKTIKSSAKLLPHKKYEIHVMMLAHTDIGYTHPQPVVKEIHSITLDDVIEMCSKDPDFKWTIETVWQLEQFENSRTKEQFERIIPLIKEGRIAVSPLYSNPFSGWTDEEEMIRGLAKAAEYKERYGIQYEAAVYNDVPGQSWMLPQVLKKAGINFIAEGINEIFNDYSFQRSLPKAFMWEGSDGSRVVTYLNEAYNEAKSLGLEGRGNKAVEQRLWEKLNTYKAQGNDYELVLINSAFGDNSIVPKAQYEGMIKWNEEYEYPKFISSNINIFAEKFSERYIKDLKVLRGDWTSNWDIYYQGEAERMKKQRWVQHNLRTGSVLGAVTSQLQADRSALKDLTEEAYRQLLHFSGHGSGLEYGYGSPLDNLITMEFREDYVHSAYINTLELLKRTMFRIGKAEESFEGEGVIVFNPLSWERDAPTEVQFTAENPQQYEVFDINRNETVPSYRDKHRMYFTARDLPAVGYKKYKLIPIQSAAKKGESKLSTGENFIENEYYRIELNKADGGVKKLFDKKRGMQLIEEGEDKFNIPQVERFQNNEKFKPVEALTGKISVTDERPVRAIVDVDYEHSIFKKIRYILWEGVDRIDTEITVDPAALQQTDKLEEYALAFPFTIGDEIMLEGLGGYLNLEKDRLPGTGGDGFSIRRSAAINGSGNSISWSSIDNRVVRIRDNESSGKKVLISDVINNFPLNWNRYEANDEELTVKYSFTNREGGFDPEFTSRFGYEVNTPVLVRRSWYRSEPAIKSYLSAEGKDVMMLSVSAGEKPEEVIVRVINVNPVERRSGKVNIRFMDTAEAYFINYLGEVTGGAELTNNSVIFELAPNEIKSIKLINSNIKEKQEAKKGG